MNYKRTRVTEDVGNPGKWVAQYYDADMRLWFDIGDARPTRQDAEVHLAATLAENTEHEARLEYLRDFDPKTVHEVPKGTPFCVHILQTSTGPDGYGFVPSVVYENVSGHFPLSGRDGGSPWVWGPSYADAVAQADRYNESIGVSPERAREIVVSSFAQAADQDKI